MGVENFTGTKNHLQLLSSEAKNDREKVRMLQLFCVSTC